MLNFNGHENTDFAGHHHNNSIFGQQSQSSSCQIFSSFPAASSNGSYAQRSMHNGANVSGGGVGVTASVVNNKTEFGAVIHNPVTGNGTYNGSENVKRFSVNNLLKLASCGGGVERVNGT